MHLLADAVSFPSKVQKVHVLCEKALFLKVNYVETWLLISDLNHVTVKQRKSTTGKQLPL